jgi:hypothetical protein
MKMLVKLQRLSRRGRIATGSGRSGQILLDDLLLGSVIMLLKPTRLYSLWGFQGWGGGSGESGVAANHALILP